MYCFGKTVVFSVDREGCKRALSEYELLSYAVADVMLY